MDVKHTLFVKKFKDEALQGICKYTTRYMTHFSGNYHMWLAIVPSHLGQVA